MVGICERQREVCEMDKGKIRCHEVKPEAHIA